MLDIYTLDDEVLREDTEKVTVFDNSLKMLVDAMFDTLVEADGVGLAAPQIGVSKKFFIVDLRRGDDGRYVFINPEIIETSMEEGPYEEGCLSIPGFYREVIRPLRVKVQAQDLNGKYFTIDADGLLARVIQHENDHLNKTLFIDHLTPEEKEKFNQALHDMGKRLMSTSIS